MNTTQRRRPYLVVAALCLAMGSGVACVQQRSRPDIRSSETLHKIPGIVEAGEVSAAEYGHEMVLALQDDDPAVRLFAIQTLEAWVGDDKGFRYFDPPERRGEAVAAWKAWLETLPEDDT